MELFTNNTLLLTVGIPGCGKSTWLNANKITPRVSSDQIRERLTGDAASQARNSEVWDIVDNGIIHFLRTQKRVAVDCTGLLPKMRRRFQAAAAYANIGPVNFVAVRFNVPFDVACERNEARDRTVPMDAMDSLYDRWNNHCSPEMLTDEGWIVVNV